VRLPRKPRKKIPLRAILSHLDQWAVSDFELRCSFRLAANNSNGFANSGIQYRSKVLDPANWSSAATRRYGGRPHVHRDTLRGAHDPRGHGRPREKVVWDKDCKKQVTGSLGSSEDLQKGIKQSDWND